MYYDIDMPTPSNIQNKPASLGAKGGYTYKYGPRQAPSHPSRHTLAVTVSQFPENVVLDMLISQSHLFIPIWTR